MAWPSSSRLELGGLDHAVETERPEPNSAAGVSSRKSISQGTQFSRSRPAGAVLYQVTPMPDPRPGHPSGSEPEGALDFRVHARRSIPLGCHLLVALPKAAHADLACIS